MARLPTPSNIAATLAALALCLSVSAHASSNASARQPFDGIVAVVDDQIIMLSELEELRSVAAEQTPGMARLPVDAQRKELLNRLIDDKVILVKAKQDTSIKVSERDILPRVDDAISRYIEQQGGEKKFETLLKQTNGMSLAQFRSRLTQQYMEQAYRQKIQVKYVGDHDPSNSQIRDFYKLYQDSLPMQQNGIKLSHIQVKVMPGAELEKSAWMKADSLIKRLDKGESFSDLAKKYSDDYSGKDGGDIGYTKRGTLDPDYERVAFSLDAGDYSKFPVRTRHGYHVIKVTGKKDTEIRTSHILVKLTPSAADTARTQALMDSLRAVAQKDTGAFPALAKKFSEDKKTKEEGGNLGWFTRDQLDPQYLSAVDSLPEGGISRPIAIGDGFHLFRLDKKASARKLNLDEDYTEISQMARNYYLGQRLSGYVKKWRETIHVEDRLAQYKNLPGESESDEGDGANGAGPAGIPLR